MMRRMSPRQARRMMESTGMKMEALQGPVQVTLRTPTREITIDDAEVSVIKVQGQTIYQVMGGKTTEKTASPPTPSITEEDIQLVVQQANVTPDTAKKALEETNGDLAQAILILTQRRTG